MSPVEAYSENNKIDWRPFVEKWLELYDEMNPQIEIQLQIERSVKAAKDKIDELVRVGTEKQDARIRDYNAERDHYDKMRRIADLYTSPSALGLRQLYSWER